MKKTSRAYIRRLGLAVIVASALLFSCERSSEDKLRLPANPILSGGPGWAVVKEAYVRLKDIPSESAKDIAYLRRGGVYKVVEREIGDPSREEDKGTWFRIEADGILGWAREKDLDIHPSVERAKRSAAALP